MSRLSRKFQRTHKPKSRTALYIALAMVLLFLVILLAQILMSRFTGQTPADPDKPRDSALPVILISVSVGLVLLAWIFLSKQQKK